MPSFVIATSRSLLIARGGSKWAVEQHLQDYSPEAVAIDRREPGHLYVGTLGNGIWISRDGGRSWEPVGDGIPYRDITAIAIAPGDGSGPAVIYAGTEPSTMSRSEDGGQNWRVLDALLELPSSSSWSFPPRPETHHVRWIEPDANTPGKLYVAIEAGAMVSSSDRGETWSDRVPGGPYDTHTAATQKGAPGRVYSSAGDGYYESHDGGETWSRFMDGLEHGYLVGVAVDPGDPTTVLVSASAGPYSAYYPGSAEAYLYRKTEGRPFELSMDGLPPGKGTVASRFATDPGRPGGMFAANNQGLFRSSDGGQSWEVLDADWSPEAFRSGVNSLAAFAD